MQGSAPSFQLVETGSLFLSLHCVLQASRPKARSSFSCVCLPSRWGSGITGPHRWHLTFCVGSKMELRSLAYSCS